MSSAADPRHGWHRNYTIRGTSRDLTIPHAACPDCYLDATSSDTGHLLQYQCPRGHQFTGQRSDGLNHATFLARFYSGVQENR